MKLLEVNTGSQAPNAMSTITKDNSSSTGKDPDKLTLTNGSTTYSKDTGNNSSSLISQIKNNMACNGDHAQRPSTHQKSHPSTLDMNDDETVFTLEVFEPSHQEQLLSGINSMRRQGQFCDITLVVDEHEYAAHRAVLATCSPYLFDFLSCLEDTAEQQPSYKLKDLSHTGFEYLLDFMYTGR